MLITGVRVCQLPTTNYQPTQRKYNPLVPDHVTSTLPPDLASLVDAWLEIERETDALVAPLDDEQFNWSPVAGVWSIGQCFDHLNTINVEYLRRIKKAVAAARDAGHVRCGPIAPTWFGRRFIASMEPPVRLKLRTPRRMRPAPRKLKAEVWPEFVRQHTHLRAFVSDECPGVDLNRAIFQNPFVPLIRMRAGTGLGVLAAHDRRHLWQAQALRQLEGFPRS